MPKLCLDPPRGILFPSDLLSPDVASLPQLQSEDGGHLIRMAAGIAQSWREYGARGLALRGPYDSLRTYRRVGKRVSAARLRQEARRNPR